VTARKVVESVIQIAMFYLIERQLGIRMGKRMARSLSSVRSEMFIAESQQIESSSVRSGMS
jgi:hypothetical protein